MATALAVAFVVYSCSGNLNEAASLDLSKTPLQVVEGMFLVQTENSVLKIRAEADRMEKYDTESSSYDIFPKGIYLYAYDKNGSLETTIRSDNARHDRVKSSGEEKWSAFGNVVINNVIKHETIKTDTLYWNQKEKEIYTDCYIEMYSLQGYMQGYGMRSDEMARNAIILKPFNSYGIVKQDTTVVVIDTANFVGPLFVK